MQFVETPEFPRLRGEKAVEALYDFVDGLEEQRGEELTDRQTTALIKFARGLISSIEAEMQSSISHKHTRETRFVGQLMHACKITKQISKSVSKALRFA